MAGIKPIRAVIKNVPDYLQNNPGLVFEIINAHIQADEDDQAAKLLEKLPAKLPYPEKWFKIKMLTARHLIEHKKYEEAYKILAHNDNISKENYLDQEWLSGWIAFSFLNKYNLAYNHFYKIYITAKSPISMSRGAFWAGLTAKKIYDPEISARWFKVAAQYTDTFYGQLSVLELYDDKPQLILAKPPIPSKEDITKFRNNELVKAAYILGKIGDIDLAAKFIKQAIRNSSNPKEIYLMTRMGLENNNLSFALIAAKEASRKGIATGKANLPVIKNLPSKVENELILGIIRQESLFDPNAISSAGARGMMQLMPQTAREICKELKIKHSVKKLHDHGHNIKLGSYNLEKLLKYYNNSYILTIAAYNAGKSNVQKWIEIYGDPRDYEDVIDIVNWVESIPFYETRNYVQRVLENVQNYRSHLNKYQLLLIEDLKK
jgi:soluble lytic murein transglycosylase